MTFINVALSLIFAAIFVLIPMAVVWVPAIEPPQLGERKSGFAGVSRLIHN